MDESGRANCAHSQTICFSGRSVNIKMVPGLPESLLHVIVKPHLYERTVLVLNRNWQAVDVIAPTEAFCHLSAGTARALLIENQINLRPFTWDAWKILPISEGSNAIGTSRGFVRIPEVVLLSGFDRMPVRVPRFGLRGLWYRDQGRCQYTGRLLAPGEGDIDHVLPRSRGGLTSWENCVLSDRRVNRKKGAKTPEEAGLKLLRRPFVPRPLPAIHYLRRMRRLPAWDLFLGEGNDRVF